MIKKYFAALSATALMGVAPYALAASSTDLTVTGTITPGACVPTLSDGGVVDHQTISAKDLNPTQPTNLPVKTLQLSINCDAAQPISLSTIDNRPGSSNDTTDHYGLGFINGNQKLGGFHMRMLNRLADGAPVSSLISNDGGTTWRASSWMEPSAPLISIGSVGSSNPIAVKDVTMDLEVRTQIARADGLDLSDNVAIDGSMTLEVGYL